MITEERRKRHHRFWQPPEKGEGGYLSIAAPVDGKPPYALPPPKDLAEQWLSVDYAVKRAEAAVQNTFWGQDAIQSVFVNMGPGVHAAMLGAPYSLQPDSVWFDLAPPIKDWDSPRVFKTDTEHELYTAIDAHIRALCAASKGRYAVSFTDIGGQLDVLYSLRGEDLLTDLIEYPDEVLAAEAQLCDEFLRYFRHQVEIIAPAGCGYTSWMPLHSDVPYYPIQCDLSVMISPAMFERFVLPNLDKVSKAIGRAIYHLDGPEEIKHLDMILSLPGVNAVQWVPLPTALNDSAAYRAQQHFADGMSLDVYRRVLAAGKKVFLYGAPPGQVAAIFDAVGSDGVFIHTYCASQSEAQALAEHARKRGYVNDTP